MISAYKNFFSSKFDLKNGVIAYGNYSFLILKEIRCYDISAFKRLSSFGAYKGIHEKFLNDHLKNVDEFLDQFSYDVSIDLLMVGSLKTILPTLELGGYETFFNTMVITKTPNNKIFPIVFYFGPSGIAISSTDSESQIFKILSLVFSNFTLDFQIQNPFDLSKENLANFLSAFSSALRRVPTTDFQAIYEHDLGKELMGLHKGVPFIREFHSNNELVVKTKKLIEDLTGKNKKNNKKYKFNHISYITTTLDGMYVISGYWDGYLSAWDYKSRKLSLLLKAHSQLISKIVLTLNSKFLLSSSFDGKICVWDFNSGVLVNTLKSPSGEPIVSTIFLSEEDRFLISCLSDYKNNKEIIWIEIYNLDTMELIKTINLDSFCFNPFIITPNKRFLIGTVEGYNIGIFDLELQVLSSLLRGHTKNIKSLYLTPDGKILISGSEDNTSCIWDLKAKTLIKLLKGGADHISFFPTLNYLVKSIYTQIYIDDLEKNQRITSFKAHETIVHGFQLLPSYEGILYCAGTSVKLIQLQGLEVQSLVSRKGF